MDDLFPNDDEFWDIDVGSRSRPPQRPRLLDDFDYDDIDGEKVYFVPFRWWQETQDDGDQVVGVLYSVSSDEDADSGILLELRKEKVHTEYGGAEEGFSGRQYALIGEAMWLQALKRHNDFEATSNYGGRFLRAEDTLQDVFPLQIRILVSWETNLLTVKINRKDNSADFYKRASIIFNPNSELFHIWDFSGQTNKLIMNNSNNFLDDSLVQRVKEVRLELQVHEILDNMVGRYGKDVKLTEEQRKTEKPPIIVNGITDKVKSHLTESGRMIAGNSFRVASSMGLAGLQNLGNTCFMNSALQCLVHTPKLVDYFLGNFQKEINHENPLGMKGELALAFGDLLRKLWAPGSMSVPPRMFKLKLANFAPQFSGYNQHDSQEFLSFLLDGLHEDLNRVKCKPYFEAKDVEGRQDEEVAEEYWQNHLARNDSIIVDLCQGQYRSTLVCPACNKLSVTFDPFMYLSLPLPSTTMRSMTLMVISCDGITLPSTFTISVPKSGRLKDLIDALSTACSLRADETLLIAEVYKNRICRVLEDPSDSLALIRNEDKLVAYRLPRDDESSKLIVYMHQQSEKHDNSGKLISGSRTFGAPFVARVPEPCHESDIRQLFLKFLDPLKMPAEDTHRNCDGEAGISANDDFEMDDASDPTNLDTDESPNDENVVNSGLPADFTFYLAHQMGASDEGTLIKSNEPLVISKSTERLDVLVMWPDTMVNKYDTCLMSSLPDVSKPNLHTRRLQESVDLYKCLEAFLKEEPLGPDDMWYCPRCKKPQQARKKLDLWRLPEILVIHLKRFSYSRFLKNKLETFVDFPIDDLDLSNYIAYQNSHLSNRYMLYAVSNHYGGMGAGHYTAYVLHGGKWYDFDDDRVLPVSEDVVKSSAAYVLFYKRIPEV